MKIVFGPNGRYLWTRCSTPLLSKLRRVHKKISLFKKLRIIWGDQIKKFPETYAGIFWTGWNPMKKNFLDFQNCRTFNTIEIYWLVSAIFLSKTTKLLISFSHCSICKHSNFEFSWFCNSKKIRISWLKSTTSSNWYFQEQKPQKISLSALWTNSSTCLAIGYYDIRPYLCLYCCHINPPKPTSHIVSGQSVVSSCAVCVY